MEMKGESVTPHATRETSPRVGGSHGTHFSSLLLLSHEKTFSNPWTWHIISVQPMCTTQATSIKR
ncbi:Hypothetical protein, putative [Bodo saltans]|uniref:Uncharacterized protein n=1 Tax=Bodo saltans TaxID=75058 RepID=A0A0S4ISV9_BODSA|nr:Hypothetical protein, putative [Bodo saltans]|eukprot:CUE73026.1 Hypothetical protein, putative [Bodo saltans]